MQEARMGSQRAQLGARSFALQAALQPAVHSAVMPPCLSNSSSSTITGEEGSGVGIAGNVGDVSVNCKLSLRISYARGGNVGEGMITDILEGRLTRGSVCCAIECVGRGGRGGCADLALLAVRVSSATTSSIHPPSTNVTGSTSSNVGARPKCRFALALSARSRSSCSVRISATSSYTGRVLVPD